MPAPLIPVGAGLLTKALAALKGGAVLAGKGAVGGGRFAGTALKALMPEGGKAALAARLAPDAAFGVLNAAMMPDEASIADRVLAGTATTLGGGLGGLAVGKVASKVPGLSTIPGVGFAADMGGSMLGDMVGHQVAMGGSAALDRLTGGEGLNVYERMSKADRDAYREQIERETLAAVGLIPGTRHDDIIGIV